MEKEQVNGHAFERKGWAKEKKLELDLRAEFRVWSPVARRWCEVGPDSLRKTVASGPAKAQMRTTSEWTDLPLGYAPPPGWVPGQGELLVPVRPDAWWRRALARVLAPLAGEGR